jgi:YHS domain-containing protein
MAVAQQDGPHFQLDGTTWWFCSPACRDEFVGDPKPFVDRARATA